MIFFTGASGVFGSGVLSEPLPFSTLSLQRTLKTPVGPAVSGDLTLPGCGLSSPDRERIQSDARVIVHAAADTRFDTPLAQARAINVEGTRRVLELAAGCKRLELFVHVSTVHVAGLRPGKLREEPVRAAPVFPNAYEQTKFESELLIQEAQKQAKSIPACIVRLTTIAGGEDTGFLERENYLHRLIRLVPTYPLPILPANPDALVDLATVEWTARAFAALIPKARPSGVYHLSAGPENCLTLPDAIHEAFSAYGRKTPRLVTTEAAHVLLKRVPNVLASYLFDTLDSVLPHFQLRQEYINERTMSLLGPTFRPPPAMDIFQRVLDRLTASSARRATA
jgi:thioester reductase-like protein